MLLIWECSIGNDQAIGNDIIEMNMYHISVCKIYYIFLIHAYSSDSFPQHWYVCCFCSKKTRICVVLPWSIWTKFSTRSFSRNAGESNIYLTIHLLTKGNRNLKNNKIHHLFVHSSVNDMGYGLWMYCAKKQELFVIRTPVRNWKIAFVIANYRTQDIFAYR